MFEVAGAGDGGPAVRSLRDPRWVPDGSGVLYVVAGDGVAEVDSRGERMRWVVRDPKAVRPVVHPSLTEVWFARDDAGSSSILRVARAGGGIARVVVPGNAVCFSPDGQFVAVAIAGAVVVAPTPPVR